MKSFETSKIVTLHGGNPEEYRGLDSLFWSIFHKDFKNLQTTLHYVKLRVDTGNIIKKLKIITNKKTNLYNLRILNVINCIKITNFYIKKILDKKKIITFRQKKIGRYYSAFPSIFIDIIKKNLANYVKKN